MRVILHPQWHAARPRACGYFPAVENPCIGRVFFCAVLGMLAAGVLCPVPVCREQG